jgi:hypothetical protein
MKPFHPLLSSRLILHAATAKCITVPNVRRAADRIVWIIAAKVVRLRVDAKAVVNNKGVQLESRVMPGFYMPFIMPFFIGIFSILPFIITQ